MYAKRNDFFFYLEAFFFTLGSVNFLLPSEALILTILIQRRMFCPCTVCKVVDLGINERTKF
jgi:hypothetical protein